MSGLTAAVVGGVAAVGGAMIQARGARKAAETSKEAADQQLAYMQEAEDRARGDIERLFPQAMERQNQGYQQQMDLYSQALPMTMDMFGQGNMNAQQTIAGSAPMAMNALLGGPVNFDFMQPRDVNYDISGLLGGLPSVYQAPEQQQQQPNTGAYSNSDFANWRDHIGQNRNLMYQMRGFGGAQGARVGSGGGGGRAGGLNIFDAQNFNLR